MNHRRSPFLPLLAGAVAAGAAALAAHALLIEPTRVEMSEHEVPVADLPPAWNGARIIQLSDLHYGDPRSDSLFEWMIRTANAAEPDLVVITGDYVVHRAEEAPPAADFLSRLRARHGVYGVLGDHDFSIRRNRTVRGLVERLAEANVRLLRNTAVQLAGGFWLAGVDPTTRKLARANLASAVSEVPGGRPHLMLSHAPDIIHDAAALEIPWMICGHTHGGQVVVPGFGPPVTHSLVSRKFASGWATEQNTRLFTSRGLASHYSLRFCCRPEISLFTLRAG